MKMKQGGLVRAAGARVFGIVPLQKYLPGLRPQGHGDAPQDLEIRYFFALFQTDHVAFAQLGLLGELTL